MKEYKQYTWKATPIEELSYNERLECIEELMTAIFSEREDRVKRVNFPRIFEPTANYITR